MKNSIFCIIYFLLSNILLAQKPVELSSAMVLSSGALVEVLPAPPVRTVAQPLRDTVMISDLTTTSGAISLPADLRIVECGLVLSLTQNPQLSAEMATGYSANTSVQVQFRQRTDPSRLHTMRVRLHIDNTLTAGAKPQSKDVFVIPDAIWADILVDSFVCTGLTPVDAAARADLFFLRAEILGEKYRVAQAGFVPRGIRAGIADNGGYVNINWNELPWADSYDLEWTFVDHYQGATSTGMLPYTFRNNATRVNIKSLNYEIPIVFERGVLVFRVRGNGRRADGTAVAGQWSKVESGNVRTSGSTSYNTGEFPIPLNLVHEQDRKNWQYIANFAENGLRRDAVSYFDGTLRNRQSITRINTNGQYLVVGETFYDHQGRAAVTALPAPLKPSPSYERIELVPGLASAPPPAFVPKPISPFTDFDPKIKKKKKKYDPFTSFLGSTSTAMPMPWVVSTPRINWPAVPISPIDPSIIGGAVPGGIPQDLFVEIFHYSTDKPALRYQPRFNLNTSGRPYSRLDFDTIAGVGRCNTHAPAKAFGTMSGAGQYYSPSNPTDPGLNKYRDLIPDAEGFPFVHTEHTPDPTGRIKRQGAPGKIHQLGRGHDQQLFYSTPTQVELDRLFGNDVGEAQFYKKTVGRDPNGQISISYQNSQGQIIAAGLAGATPDVLLPVEQVSAAQRNDLVAENSRLEAAGSVKIAAKPIVIVQDNTDLRIDYSLDPAQFSTATCSGALICDNCVYDLQIRITDDCGRVRWNVAQRIGNLDALQNCTTNTAAVANTTLRLNTGTYFVEKTLRVNADNRARFVANYLNQIRPCVEAEIRPTIESLPCVTDQCIPCSYDFESFSGIQAYVRKEGNNPACTRRCGDEGMYDHFAYLSMLNDLRPGGQYGEIYNIDRTDGSRIANPSTFPLSVFSTTNGLNTFNTLLGFPASRRRNYQNPVFDYRNADGSIAEIEVTDLPETYYVAGSVILRDGRKYVSPKHFLNVALIADLWQEAWSESLLPYHPEYPYFMWNLANQAAIQYDTLLMRTRTWTDAISAGYITTGGAAVTADFLRRDPFFSNPDRTTRMLNELNNINMGGMRINIFQLIRISIRCNSPYYEDPARSVALSECYGTGNLSDLNPSDQKFAWEMFRSFYMSKKSQLMSQVRNAELSSAGLMSNACIQASIMTCPECSDTRLRGLLESKQRRFQQADCLGGGRDALPIRRMDADGDGWLSGTPDGIRAERYGNFLAGICGIDKAAQGWLYFLTALQMEGQLTAANVTIPSRPPVSLMREMIALFPNRSVPTYRWTGTVAGRDLNIRITDPSGTEQAQMRLSIVTDGVSWDQISYFTCIECNAKNNNYRITAYTKNGEHRRVSIRVVSEHGFNLKDNCLSGVGGLESDQSVLEMNEDYSCCIPIFPPLIPAPPCDLIAEQLERANEGRAIETRLAYLADSIRLEYTGRCIAAAERLILTWNEPMYQFTLFYYDQAGNLIKSVPPKGISPLENEADIQRVQRHRNAPRDNNAFYPEHNDDDGNAEALATTYQYNSLNQKTRRTTPDDGTLRWRYDQVGRPILAQDPVQAGRNVFNYMEYDAHGRLIENGIVPGHADFNERIAGSGMTNYGRFKAQLTRATKTEVYRTHYDTPNTMDVQSKFTGGGQKRLRNRVATTAYYADGADSPDYATHFSYDIAGNVTEYLQDYRALATDMSIADATAHSQKLIRYQYDLITGNVKEIAYQPGAADQYYQWYEYDADNRVIAVQTGLSRYESPYTRDRDIHYKYSLHGPLARAEFGQANIQGLDFAYTITGKLKNMNSIAANDDPGQDGFGNNFATDATALSLGYYNGDYKPIGRSALSPTNAALESAAPSLYNGNIRYSISRNNGLDNHPLIASAYQYDQVHRLRAATVMLPGLAPTATASTGSVGLFDAAADMGWTSSNQWKMTLDYDKNGNITHLNRRNESGGALDDLAYRYNPNTNSLNYISDTDGQIAATGTVVDLPDQGEHNYQYDAKGRLIHDRSEGNAELYWSANDKLMSFSRGGQNTRFAYDAFGRRALKKSDERNGTLTVRDARGQVMVNYAIRNGHVFRQDVPLYAGSRFGTWQPDDSLVMSRPALAFGATHYSFRSGQKGFELTNQTTDVLALVSDRKLPVTLGSTSTWSADYLQAQDYYPFGMPMPGRVKETTHKYAFGFQGMERDNDLKGEGNSYSTEFRQYDPRVGRWLSLDPKMEKYPQITPYSAFLDDPIQKTDIKGDDVTEDIEQLRSTTAQLSERVGQPVEIGQRVEVLRYSREAGRNYIYSVVVGGEMPRGTEAAHRDAPDYIERSDISSDLEIVRGVFVSVLEGLSAYFTALSESTTEIGMGGASMAHYRGDALRIASTLSEFQGSEVRVRAAGLRTARVLSTAVILSNLQSSISGLIDGLDELSALDSDPPSSLAARVDAVSHIFDGVVGILDAVGVPMPDLLTEDFVRIYGRSVFANPILLEQILDEEVEVYPRGLCRDSPCPTIRRR